MEYFDFGKALRAARIDAQMTQEDAALRAGITVRTASDIENMDNSDRSPSFRNVERYAMAVGLSLAVGIMKKHTLDDVLLQNKAEMFSAPKSDSPRFRPIKHHLKIKVTG